MQLKTLIVRADVNQKAQRIAQKSYLRAFLNLQMPLQSMF